MTNFEHTTFPSGSHPVTPKVQPESFLSC